MKRLLFFLLAALPALAAVDGVVVNGTTGQPQSGVQVSLVQPSQDSGMRELSKTVSDSTGKFSFQQVLPLETPTLIQATYQAVTYTKALTPGSPTTGLQVEVYDSSKKAGIATISQHMILVQPTGTEVAVSEVYMLRDESKITFNDPKNGTLRFYVPPDSKAPAEVTITAPNGMPVKRTGEKTKQADVYKIDYPIRPGETRIDLDYSLPPGNPSALRGKVLQKGDMVRVIAPQGVTFTSEDIKLLGTEPTTQASIYEVSGDSFKIAIEGTGTLQRASAATPDSGEDSGEPQIQELPPHIYNKIYWILGLIFAILGLGSYLLARNPAMAGKK